MRLDLGAAPKIFCNGDGTWTIRVCDEWVATWNTEAQARAHATRINSAIEWNGSQPPNAPDPTAEELAAWRIYCDEASPGPWADVLGNMDGVFIATAREAMPRLLDLADRQAARVATLERERARLREAIEDTLCAFGDDYPVRMEELGKALREDDDASG